LASARQRPYAYNLSTATASGFDGSRIMYKIPGERMKRWGSTMTMLGGGLIIGGIIVVANADPDYNRYNSYYNTYDTTDPKYVWGTIMIVYGVGLTVPGVILWTRGIKKYNEYYEQQRQLSFRMQGNGVSLKYSW
ncbi:MAG: hypothetical protein HC859_09385, partial [Bacteroidia bacterium]|nr:hypothetical protein [Bacteroidia bacterium]